MINLKPGKPVVSVVMATYNETADFIRCSIESILGQTFQDLELLIIDDSTNLETILTIDELANDSRIITIREPMRIGFVKALNIGLKKAKGKYIARMDGDDIAEKNRLELQVSFLEQNPCYSVVGGAMNIINEEGVITSRRSYPASSFKLNLWSVFRNPIAHPTVMFRRNIVDQGLFYDETLMKSEDLEFWLRLMKNGYKLYNLPDILLNFRVSGDLGTKRAGDNFIYNYKARYKNFSWKSPVRSFLSLCMAKAYILMPEYIIKKVYAFENMKNK